MRHSNRSIKLLLAATFFWAAGELPWHYVHVIEPPQPEHPVLIWHRTVEGKAMKLLRSDDGFCFLYRSDILLQVVDPATCQA